MKKTLFTTVIAVLLVVGFSAVFVFADPCTELRFGNAEPTYSITAFYDVLTENVDSVSVVFAAEVAGDAYANYIPADRQLRISIASADPIDLAKSLGTVSATLIGGETVAAELKLTYLKFNGVKATSNVMPIGIRGEITDGVLSAQLTLRDELKGTVQVLVAAYAGNGQLLKLKFATVTFSSVEQTFPVELGSYTETTTLKAYFADTSWKAYNSALVGIVE